MSIFSTARSNGIQKTCHEGPSEPITLKMIKRAISKVASDKVAGPLGILAEILKPSGEDGVVEVRDLIEDIISGGGIPTD